MQLKDLTLDERVTLLGLLKLVIQADREVPTALLLRVLDTCKAAGAESVDIAAIAR